MCHTRYEYSLTPHIPVPKVSVQSSSNHKAYNFLSCQEGLYTALHLYDQLCSQLLHTALYLANTFKLSPAKATFPVTGRIRKAYQSILQLLGFTIFIDQNFSTVVTLITHIDIEADDGPNGTGNVLVTASQYDVGGFAAALFAIVLPIVLGLVVKNYMDYCSCFKVCTSETDRWRCYRCCCNCQCFENGVISV